VGSKQKKKKRLQDVHSSNEADRLTQALFRITGMCLFKDIEITFSNIRKKDIEVTV
jgi:hypothetical protein